MAIAERMATIDPALSIHILAGSLRPDDTAEAKITMFNLTRKIWLIPARGLSALTCSLAVGYGQSKTVWRIGTLDHSSAEFAPASPDKPVTPPPPVIYRVGPQASDKQWPAFQPTAPELPA